MLRDTHERHAQRRLRGADTHIERELDEVGERADDGGNVARGTHVLCRGVYLHRECGATRVVHIEVWELGHAVPLPFVLRRREARREELDRERCHVHARRITCRRESRAERHGREEEQLLPDAPLRHSGE